MSCSSSATHKSRPSISTPFARLIVHRRSAPARTIPPGAEGHRRPQAGKPEQTPFSAERVTSSPIRRGPSVLIRRGLLAATDAEVLGAVIRRRPRPRATTFRVAEPTSESPARPSIRRRGRDRVPSVRCSRDRARHPRSQGCRRRRVAAAPNHPRRLLKWRWTSAGDLMNHPSLGRSKGARYAQVDDLPCDLVGGRWTCSAAGPGVFPYTRPAATSI